MILLVGEQILTWQRNVDRLGRKMQIEFAEKYRWTWQENIDRNRKN